MSEVPRRFAEATTHYERLLESVAHSLAEVIRDSCTVFLIDAEAQTLEIAYKRTGAYRYPGVPPAEYRRLMKSDSIGPISEAE